MEQHSERSSEVLEQAQRWNISWPGTASHLRRRQTSNHGLPYSQISEGCPDLLGFQNSGKFRWFWALRRCSAIEYGWNSFPHNLARVQRAYSPKPSCRRRVWPHWWPDSCFAKNGHGRAGRISSPNPYRLWTSFKAFKQIISQEEIRIVQTFEEEPILTGFKHQKQQQTGQLRSQSIRNPSQEFVCLQRS